MSKYKCITSTLQVIKSIILDDAHNIIIIGNMLQ